MRSEAHTGFMQIDIGTRLNLIAAPQVAGQSPDILTANVDLQSRSSNVTYAS
jgi:hypothetical protein